jgi:integrase
MFNASFDKTYAEGEMTVHTLPSLLDRYQMAVEVSGRYAESLRRTVRKAESSGLVNVCQLSAEPVNRMLAGLRLSPVTVGNIRRELLTLWRYAYEEGLTETPPARVRKIKAVPAPPVCWTKSELERLMQLASSDETPISSRVQARRCDVLPAWIGINYDTGMRFGDVLTLAAHHIRHGCVMTTAHKTGKPLVRALSAKTLAAIMMLQKLSPDRTLFLWCIPRRRALMMWRQFLDQHGFQGSSKWLRRSAATQVALGGGGTAAATALLQHSHPSLAIRHYIDQSQFGVPAGPPPIGG